MGYVIINRLGEIMETTFENIVARPLKLPFNPGITVLRIHCSFTGPWSSIIRTQRYGINTNELGAKWRVKSYSWRIHQFMEIPRKIATLANVNA